MGPPIVSNSSITMPKQAASGLGAAKRVRGRGTYEGLAIAQAELQRGQTGRGLRETLVARQQGKGRAAARANALIAQAGLPQGFNNTLQQPTMDILTVRMQRQAFMFRQAL